MKSTSNSEHAGRHLKLHNDRQLSKVFCTSAVPQLRLASSHYYSCSNAQVIHNICNRSASQIYRIFPVFPFLVVIFNTIQCPENFYFKFQDFLWSLATPACNPIQWMWR